MTKYLEINTSKMEKERGLCNNIFLSLTTGWLDPICHRIGKSLEKFKKEFRILIFCPENILIS